MMWVTWVQVAQSTCGVSIFVGIQMPAGWKLAYCYLFFPYPDKFPGFGGENLQWMIFLVSRYPRCDLL